MDTNVIVSVLVTERGACAKLLDAWTEHRFVLVTSSTQMDEIIAVTRNP